MLAAALGPPNWPETVCSLLGMRAAGGSHTPGAASHWHRMPGRCTRVVVCYATSVRRSTANNTASGVKEPRAQSLRRSLSLTTYTLQITRDFVYRSVTAGSSRPTIKLALDQQDYSTEWHGQAAGGRSPDTQRQSERLPSLVLPRGLSVPKFRACCCYGHCDSTESRVAVATVRLRPGPNLRQRSRQRQSRSRVSALVQVAAISSFDSKYGASAPSSPSHHNVHTFSSHSVTSH